MNLDQLQKMNSTQVHRGPDANGVYIDELNNIYLGMTRLSIVDVFGGTQPMISECSNFVIVFNGEIFNAPQLRKDLESKGIKFNTDHSDTEVVLQLYIIVGENIASRLNGMFAFVIYDKKKRVLFCCRDQLGIKPFFYSTGHGEFFFASEIKALRRLGIISDQLDRASISEYFCYQRITDGKTIYEDIKSLDAGNFLIYDIETGLIKVREYWNSEKLLLNSTVSLKIDKLEALLCNAVDRWMMGDVPVACSLSGGLDSALVVAIASRSTGRGVDTFTLGFENEPDLDESIRAEKVAHLYGSRHSHILLTESLFSAELDNIVLSLDEPYAGGTPSWFVYKAIATRFKVALTGVGGDELFGNYGKWRPYESALIKFRYLLNFIRRKGGISFKDSRDLIQLLYRPMVFFPSEQQSLLIKPVDYIFDRRLNDAFTRFSSPRDAIASYDLRTQLPQEFLFMTDRFSMKHSLEVRTPFLDIELVEAVLKSNSRNLFEWDDPKSQLRAIAQRYLPIEVLTARKQGFILPYKKWLRTVLSDELEAMCCERYLEKQQLFQVKTVQNLVQRFLAGDNRLCDKVLTYFMFQKWFNLTFGR